MRKILLSMLLLLCMLLPAAALADAFTFAEQGASFEVSGSKYTIITADNVDGKTDWLTRKGTTAEAVREDFQTSGRCRKDTRYSSRKS